MTTDNYETLPYRIVYEDISLSLRDRWAEKWFSIKVAVRDLKDVVFQKMPISRLVAVKVWPGDPRYKSAEFAAMVLWSNMPRFKIDRTGECKEVKET